MQINLPPTYGGTIAATQIRKQKINFKSILCIGEKSAHFKKELTDFGFLCIEIRDVLQAAGLLKKALGANGFMPDAIIADADMEPSSLNNLLNLLKNSARFRAVPLLLFDENLNQQSVKKFYSIAMIDDVYNKSSDVNEMVKRIEFLSMFKKQINTMAAECVTVVPNTYKFEPNYFFKRTIDILFAATLLIVLFPVFLLIAAAICIDSRGPVFYKSKRAGKAFKVFSFYKFRTMYTDADTGLHQLKHLNQYEHTDEKQAGFFKIENDPRVTKIGSFLRNTSLDELPQLYNVLIGNMSIVGNRPLPLYEAHTITTDVWSKRFHAPAGLTGLWQVKKRGQEDMSATERLDLDISYANQWSFMADLWILFKTPAALLQKNNV